ncbi:MAG: hypothetical protein JWQ78_1518 [Sediminibacterium sp.]|nr:hypothetical protein [Sediminibacterium sp.]
MWQFENLKMTYGFTFSNCHIFKFSNYNDNLLANSLQVSFYNDTAK